MQLTELLNPNNIYRFHLSDGGILLGQVTREGSEFLQVGVQEKERMSYCWVNKSHVIKIEYLATSFQQAISAGLLKA